MGIDVGSTASKCVIMKDGQEIVAKSLVPVGTGTSGPARAIAEVLDNAKMTREQMDFVLATGYGRNSLDGLADLQMSELSCHAKGATYLFPDVHTVVDIGGQDVKVIEIENGMMKNFVMNDKCAAGTGRFLDVMARVLEVKVEELGDLGDKSTKEVGISSTCTVFAESEVISQLAMGTNKCDIIHGIHKSVAGRVSGLCHHNGLRAAVEMTSGVAQNHANQKAHQQQLDHNLHMLGLKTDNLMELTYTDRKRIHNLKYYTWVEQQARDVKDLNALWYDTKGTWDAVHAQAAELDELINEFNEATGLLKAL